MSSQIFKKPIPNELFFNLLNDIAFKIDNYYMINNDSYKKGIFNNKIQTSLFLHTYRTNKLEKRKAQNSIDSNI
jgi:hypothetical protein